MTDITKATPRPWRDDGDCWVCKDDTMLADCADVQEDSWPRETQLANATLIVRAVNAHDALIEALRAMCDHYHGVAAGGGTNKVMAKARAALALAEGKP